LAGPMMRAPAKVGQKYGLSAWARRKNGAAHRRS
jgi:hypothetical protein